VKSANANFDDSRNGERRHRLRSDRTERKRPFIRYGAAPIQAAAVAQSE
jgi:hypothetical protein